MPREINEDQEQDVAGAEPDSVLVTAMYAGSQDEAERCRDLLMENGIPATLGEPGEQRRVRSSGIPLLVPERLLESASEILSARTEDEGEAGVDGSAEDDEDADEDFDDDYDDEDEFEAEDEDSWDDDDDEVEDDEDFE